ncbi:MAG: hypothetical protein IPF99_19900 [Deltaproteobacteria bacterium]|nr:hypothetical protein [Deltaproteobacteria bacterium]
MTARTGYHKVSQHMPTDIFTVRPYDLVELVADLMSWGAHPACACGGRQPGCIAGLVTQRVVLRHLADLAKQSREAGGERPAAWTSCAAT